MDTDEADDGTVVFRCVFLAERLELLLAVRRLLEMNATKGVKGAAVPKGATIGIIVR